MSSSVTRSRGTTRCTLSRKLMLKQWIAGWVILTSWGLGQQFLTTWRGRGQGQEFRCRMTSWLTPADLSPKWQSPKVWKTQEYLITRLDSMRFQLIQRRKWARVCCRFWILAPPGPMLAWINIKSMVRRSRVLTEEAPWILPGIKRAPYKTYTEVSSNSTQLRVN